MSARDQRYPTFSWWQGIVEDRNDPAYAGRYRVRIYGHHTQSKEKLPTAHLPWAIPMQPVTSAAISGVGQSPTGLVEGSAVIGFFVDGDEGQIPVIMGSFGVTTFMPKEGDDGTVIDPDRVSLDSMTPTIFFQNESFLVLAASRCGSRITQRVDRGHPALHRIGTVNGQKKVMILVRTSLKNRICLVSLETGETRKKQKSITLPLQRGIQE